MAKRGLCMLLAVAALFSLAAPAFAEEAPAVEPVVEVTEEPAVTEVPIEGTIEGADVSVDVPDVSVDSPDVSAADTEEPIVTEIPAEVTEVPAETTEEPVEATEEPVEVTEEPADTEEPAATEEPVVEATEAPVVVEEPSPIVEIASGTCGDNVNWSLSNTTLTISGEGAMNNFSQTSPWGKYYVESIVIKPGVTRIGDYSFFSCKALTNVSIPNTVTSIGRFAFYGCEALASVAFPASLTTLELDAFDGCKSLTSLVIPGTLTDLGDGAFRACSSLKSVTISEGVTNMGESVFMDCTSLTGVTVPGTVTGIGAGAFSGCTSLQSATIKPGVTYIGGVAFCNCGALTSVTIPDTVTSIGMEAFQNCKALTSVTIPGSVTSIGLEAFEGCTSLASVKISEGVTSIGEEAFRSCTSLTYVTIPASMTSIGNIAFSGCTNLESLLILSPSCNIITSFTFFPGATLAEPDVTVIYGYPGSTAQAYAASKGYTFKPLEEAPTAPTKPAAPKLSKAENTATGVKISWGKVSGAAKYTVYYKTTGSWKKLAEVTDTSYTWTKAKSGTKYTFTVKAINNTGESGYDKTGKSVTYVAAPKVKVANAADGIKVSWGKCAGAVKYRVYYKTSANGKWTKIGDTTATSYTRKNAKLTSGKTYYFTVRCVSKDGKTAVSGYDNAGKSVKFVKAPTVKAAKASGGIKISWDKITGAGKYQVFYKTGGSGWQKLAVTTKTSYTWTKAKSGTTYSFTVRCMNAKGAYVSAYNTKGVSITYKK